MDEAAYEEQRADRTDDFGPPGAAAPDQQRGDHAQHTADRHAERSLGVGGALVRHDTNR